MHVTHPHPLALVEGKWSRKVLLKFELCHHPVGVVWLDKDIEHHLVDAL
jgi:hypothetical protein